MKVKSKAISVIVIIAFILGFFQTSFINVARADESNDVQLMGEWDLPTKYRLDDSTLTQQGLSFFKVDATNRVVELKCTMRAWATPAVFEWIYLRLDPELAKYVTEISAKNTAKIGLKSTYTRWFEKVQPDTIAELQLTGTKSDKKDPYSQWSNDAIYRVPFYANAASAPYAKASKKYVRNSFLMGNWGVFPTMPMESERYECIIRIQLNDEAENIRKATGKDFFGVQWRIQGNKAKDGTAVISRDSLNRGTAVDLRPQSVETNKSNWLNAPMIHKVTTKLEGQIIGDNGKYSNELQGTGKTLVRVQNTIMNNLPYGSAVDLNRPVSFHIQIDPRLFTYVADGDYVKVWQVYRESNINGHDGKGYPIVKIPKSAFQNGKVEIRVDGRKAPKSSFGEVYPDEPGVIYINNVESFLNTSSSSPFIGANFVDLPLMADAMKEAASENIFEQFQIATWFSDVKQDKQRQVRNTFASSYLNVYPLTVNMYRVNSENQLITENFQIISQKPLEQTSPEEKEQAKINSVVTTMFKGESLKTAEVLSNLSVPGHKFVTAIPEEITVTGAGQYVDSFYLPAILPVEDPNAPTPDGYHRVTFLAGDNGKFKNINNKKQITIFDVLEGELFDLKMAPKVTANEGFTFDKWNYDFSQAITKTMDVTAQYIEASRIPHTLKQEGNVLTAKVDVVPEKPIDPETTAIYVVDVNGKALLDNQGRELIIPGQVDEEGNIRADIHVIPDGTEVKIKLQEKDKGEVLSEESLVISKEKPNPPSLEVPNGNDQNEIVIGYLVGNVYMVEVVAGEDFIQLERVGGEWQSSLQGYTVEERDGKLYLTPKDIQKLDGKVIKARQINDYGRPSDWTEKVAHTIFNMDKVTGFAVTKDPATMTYHNNEPFNPTGMEVTLTDVNGNKKVIDSAHFSENNITIWPAQNENLTVEKHNDKKVSATMGDFSGQTQGALKVAYGDQTKLAVEPIHTGDIVIKGKTDPSAVVTIDYTGSNGVAQKDKVVANDQGNYEFKIEPAHYPSDFKINAKAEGKSAATEIVEPVRPNTKDLQEAIKEGEFASKDIDTNTQDPEDKELLDAIKAGKELLNDNNEAKPNVTQQEVDDAAKRIRDAIKAKEDADQKEQTEKEKEEKRQANIAELEKAIKKGEDFLRDNPDVITEDRDKLQDAIDEAKKDLNNLKDDNRDDDPTDAKIATDIKNINDAIDGARTKSDQPTIGSVKNGATTISGTGHAGDTITVTFPGGFTHSTMVTPEGKWSLEAPKAVNSGEVITAVAKANDPKKVASDPVEKTVGLDTEKLEAAIDKATPIVEKGLDETSPIDKELKDALDNANQVLEKAKKDPAEATQKDVDDAAKRLEDALKNKADKDAAKDAVDQAKENPTDENIKDAQDKIDKLPDGKDKDDLQDELDKINKTGELTINDLSNGATTVAGKAPAGSKIEVKLPNGTSAFGEATAEGTYTVTVPALSGGDTITVVAKDGNKAPVEKTATVQTDVTDLKAAIGEGEQAAEGIDPNTQDKEDKELLDAIKAGKDLLDENGNAKPGVSQQQADDAAKRIRDAIKAKEIADGNQSTLEKNIKDLEDAIKRGEDFLEANKDNDKMNPAYKEDVQKAVDEAKKDLANLKDGNPENDPAQPKIDKDIKDIDDAIAKAKNTMDEPTVDPIKNGANTVSGTTTPGAKVEVTLPNGNTVTTTAGDDGRFTVSTGDPLVSGEKVVVKVIDPTGKRDPATKEVTVGLNTDELQKSVDKATPVVEKGLDPASNTDKALQDAYDKAKDVLDKAGKDPSIDQEAIDKAKKDLDDALAEKEKFEDAKSAVDTAKQNPSEETIKNAQDKIDAMKDGADKDKLQKELDKVKLEDAIKKGEDKLKDDTLDPKSKEDLTNAVDEAKKDLEKLNDDDPSNDPSKDKVNEDVKNIEDLIAGAKNKTANPSIDPLKKGATTISGSAEDGATVTIKVGDKVVATLVATGGKYSTTVDALEDGAVVKAQATLAPKTASDEVTATVGVDPSGLNEAIKDGETVLEKHPNDPKTPADEKLEKAIEEGKKLVDQDGNAKDGVTQEQLDKAEKDIRDAIAEKEATDAVNDLKDKQDKGESVTPEEVQDVQDKIDKVPGSTDPEDSDFSETKKDLQDKLDSVANLELLKHYVEKANDRLGKEDIATKPEEVVNELTESKDAGQTIIDAKGEGSTAAQIKEAVDRIIKALEEIEKEAAIASVTSPHTGDKMIRIQTYPPMAKLKVYVNDELAAELESDPMGGANVSLSTLLKLGDQIRVEISADGYLDNATYSVV